ncbi:MAG: ABC transporter permease [Pseudomonadota bacterium]
MQSIPLLNLSVVFLPTLALLMIMRRWRLAAGSGFYANARMLVQLLLVGYVLTFVFETDDWLVIIAIVVLMIGAAAAIALRSSNSKGIGNYTVLCFAIGVPGALMLILVTQFVLQMERWFEPRFVIPIAGMIFANSMNSVALSAERCDSEVAHGVGFLEARRAALEAALIPQINSLLAVGLVALPGMMTGQILSGVDPLVAARYQIMVMWMLFGSGGLSAVAYLSLSSKKAHPA